MGLVEGNYTCDQTTVMKRRGWAAIVRTADSHRSTGMNKQYTQTNKIIECMTDKSHKACCLWIIKLTSYYEHADVQNPHLFSQQLLLLLLPLFSEELLFLLLHRHHLFHHGRLLLVPYITWRWTGPLIGAHSRSHAPSRVRRRDGAGWSGHSHHTLFLQIEKGAPS